MDPIAVTLMVVGFVTIFAVIVPPILAVFGIVLSRVGILSLYCRWMDFWVKWGIEHER